MKRTISKRQRSWLLSELSAWSGKGILSEEQTRTILGLYETPEEVSSRSRRRTIFVLMGLAACLVGLALLLVFGYNWEAMPRTAKLAVIFGVIAATHAGAFYLRYAVDARGISEVVFFLGCLFYGAGVWLIAQIFHLNAHYPTGVLWWAVGVLPFALVLDTLLLHLLLVGLLGLWVGLEILQFGHLGWWFPFWSDFFPNGAYLLPFLALPGLLWAYRKSSPFMVGLYAALLAWWVVLQPVAWRWEVSVIYFIGAVGALFLVVAESHKPGSRFAIPYRLYGTLMCGGALAPLSFFEANKALIGKVREAGLTQSLVIILVALVTLGVTGFFKRRSAHKLGSLPVQVLEFVQRQWFPLCLLLFMAFLPLWNMPGHNWREVSRAAIPPTILANGFMIVCAFWLISTGVREDRGRPFAAGVVYFLLWAVLRYADLFGDFGGMLGAALMFFLCGATLFGVSLYWRRRKEVRHA